MQGTPRLTFSRRRRLINGGIILLSAFLAGGIGVAVSQASQARTTAAETAAVYKPAVTYTAPPAPTEVAFLGDSFTVGTGSSTRADRWTTSLSMDNHWMELNYGYGGTNYATAGTLKGGRAYADRLTDIIISQPDIVIVSSAGNNVTDDQTPGIAATFRELQEQIPDARIIATSPYYRADDFPKALIDFGDDVRAGVEAVGGEYLDIGHPLEGHTEAMDEDGVHPNDLGYELIAEAVQEALDSS
ncbi:SGNH/GDSL hydrolase family protein [Kocuria arenosa]|uniref:SGNH/GDSL hydrolase family protein n=1 Tax=Kocuria arenosa TaxID=3071446 RepID=UPI0034D6CDC8